jgi:hypothetical protein
MYGSNLNPYSPLLDDVLLHFVSSWRAPCICFSVQPALPTLIGSDEARMMMTTTTTTAPAAAVSFPFETDPDDHCESPLDAYEHILPLLQSYERQIMLRRRNNKKAREEEAGAAPSAEGGRGDRGLSIYDPYYCNGQVARHLASLGFPSVYNRKEDCYAVWADLAARRQQQQQLSGVARPSSASPAVASSVPWSYDVLVTNPPYSGDHIERLLRHVTRSERNGGRGSSRPWMLLLPAHVHKWDSYRDLTEGVGQRPIYIVPHRRYVYRVPSKFRPKRGASDTHKKSSPFPSCWYLWGGTQEVTDEWYRILVRVAAAAARQQQQQESPPGRTAGRGMYAAASFSVARSRSALRDLRRKDNS